MWVSVHLLTGAATGQYLVERTGLPRSLALPAGAVLHAVLDAVPHWDYTRHRRRPLWTAFDLAAAAALLLLGRRRLDAWALAAGVASAAPDLDVAHEALPFLPRSHRLFPSHRPGFPHGTAAPAPGIIVQVIAGLAAFLFLTRARSSRIR